VRTIVAILAAHVRKAETERARAKPPNSWQAYDYYLKGVEALNSFSKSLAVDDLYEARRLMRQSLAIDPGHARSYAVLANTYIAVWINRLDGDFLSPGALDQSDEFARKAVELDANLPEAHAALGFALMFRREHDASITAFERAVALNPNYVNWPFGVALVFAGDARRAIDVINAYVRLDPLYAPVAYVILGFAYYMLKQYAKALPLLRDIVSQSPKVRTGHVLLAATYAQMGKLEEAQAAAAEVIVSSPKYTIGGIARPTASFKDPKDDEHYFDGLRKAGLPE